MRKSKPLGIFLAFILGVTPIFTLLWGLGNSPTAYAVTITVNTTDDENNNDGDCSLREAVQAANNDTAVDACGPGVGPDLIQFNLPTPAVITLTQGQIVIEKQPLTISGPGADQLAVSGNNASRIFDVSANSPITLSGLTVRDGFTFFDGGGIRSGGAVTLIDSAFVNNSAGDDGGALNVWGNLTMTNTAILSNTAAGQGGGVNSFGAATILSGGLFQHNRAGDLAGGLYADKDLQVDGTQFVDNFAQNYAGAVWAWQNAAVQNARFAVNAVQNYDMGALYVRFNLVLTDTTFISNTAHVNGGAILVGGDARILNGSFTENVAETGRGGALDAAGGLWVTSTHFIANEAVTLGGGVAFGGSDGRFLNTLFARNTANDGSALSLAHSGNVAITHATIAGPEQPSDNALYLNSGGSVTVSNSIIGGYAIGIKVAAGDVAEDYTLFYETTPTSGAVSGGDRSFSGDPAFAAPASDDYHLSPNSEALNTGGDSGILVDGDGDPRPGGSGVDIGYDETAYVSDVGITKTVTANPAAGEPIVYTISFTNMGTALLPRLILTDTIPAQVTGVNVINSGVVLSGSLVGATYVWQAQSLAPGQGGVITISGTLVDPLPRGIFTNTVTVATIAVESDWGNNSAAVSLTVPNIAPVATNDRFTATEDTAVILSPLSNDVDGDPLHIESVGQPALGTAVLSGVQQVIYTPTLNMYGSDTFTYTISDDELTDTAVITVNITPVNDPPVIAEGETIPVLMSEDGSPTPFQLTLHASDVDGDPLTWSVTTTAAHGTASVAAGPTIMTTVTYTPTSDYAGPDLFALDVTDGELSDRITVTLILDPVNDTPMAVDDTAVALRQRSDGKIKILASGPGGSLNVINNDVDIEGGTLLVVDASAGEYGGVVDVTGDGRLLDYAPTADFTGIERFVYTMTDGELEDTAVISLTVANGMDGGIGGDIFSVPAIGLDNTISVTADIPANAAVTGNFALILDVPQTGNLAAAANMDNSAPDGFVSAGLNFSLLVYLDGQPVDSSYQFAQPVTLTIDYTNADIANIGPSEQSLGLYVAQGGSWVEGSIQIVERDTARHRLVVAVDQAGEFQLFRRGFIFLPLVANNYVSAPDLIVESLTILSSGDAGGMVGDIQLVIQNVGTAAVMTEFWVDVYINPRTPPTAVNQTWEMIGDEGLVWGVTADILPINPGESLTLTLESSTYKPDLSHVIWPLAANEPLYAQVDSVGGAVLEIHEIAGEPYNNIYQLP